jgi:hypothetical protein
VLGGERHQAFGKAQDKYNEGFERIAGALSSFLIPDAFLVHHATRWTPHNLARTRSSLSPIRAFLCAPLCTQCFKSAFLRVLCGSAVSPFFVFRPARTAKPFTSATRGFHVNVRDF